MEEMLVATSISHFLTAAIKFSYFSSTEIGFPFFLISHSSSFPVFHVDADINI